MKTPALFGTPTHCSSSSFSFVLLYPIYHPPHPSTSTMSTPALTIGCELIGAMMSALAMGALLAVVVRYYEVRLTLLPPLLCDLPATGSSPSRCSQADGHALASPRAAVPDRPVVLPRARHLDDHHRRGRHDLQHQPDLRRARHALWRCDQGRVRDVGVLRAFPRDRGHVHHPPDGQSPGSTHSRWDVIADRSLVAQFLTYRIYVLSAKRWRVVLIFTMCLTLTGASLSLHIAGWLSTRTLAADLAQKTAVVWAWSAVPLPHPKKSRDWLLTSQITSCAGTPSTPRPT